MLAGMFPPQRIVCLTEETVEALYLLGEQDRIVGISHYVVRPARAKQEKPRVSSFISGNVDEIVALKPDMVLAFSDVQADYAALLVKRGLEVFVFNQRTVAEILDAIRMLGALVGCPAKAAALADELAANVEATRQRAATLPRRPKVYFEEWDDPLISCISWVSELVEAAGGDEIFAERRGGRAAKERFVEPQDVLDRAPELVLASWCGKKFSRKRFEARPGFADLPAVRAGQVFEVPSPIILQPGPAALTDGLAALEARIRACAAAPGNRPG